MHDQDRTRLVSYVISGYFMVRHASRSESSATQGSCSLCANLALLSAVCYKVIESFIACAILTSRDTFVGAAIQQRVKSYQILYCVFWTCSCLRSMSQSSTPWLRLVAVVAEITDAVVLSGSKFTLAHHEISENLKLFNNVSRSSPLLS